MWRKQDEPKAPSPSAETTAKPVPIEPQKPSSNQTASIATPPLSNPPAGHLTRLLVVKGEILGKDDLFVDGEVHGKIRLDGGKLTIGPEGRVLADVDAREIVVRGEARGNIRGRDRVQIAATGRVFGEIATRLISIEDGAEVHVKVNLEREERPRLESSAVAGTKPVSDAHPPAPEEALAGERMSFISKLRTPNSLASGSAAAARPAYGRNVRGPTAPLHAPGGAAVQTSEKSSGRFSNGLKEFLWQIQDISRGSVLDLGAVSQATLTYFIERNFKVYTEDLLAAWGAFLEYETGRLRSLPPDSERPDMSPGAQAERFLAANLRYPEDSFDAVLLWDVLDYMDREMAKRLLPRIRSLIREGGAVLAIFHTRPPEQFQRYRVLDVHNLELVPRPL